MSGLYAAYLTAIQRQLWAHQASGIDSALALEDIDEQDFDLMFAAIVAGRQIEEALDPSLRSDERREKVALIMGVLAGVELKRRRTREFVTELLELPAEAFDKGHQSEVARRLREYL